jgi:hypothetical protein
MWERMFSGTGASIERLRCDEPNFVQAFIRYIYIGIPWFVFAVIDIAVIISLSPLWLLIMSPVGTGMYGPCLAVGLSSPDFRTTSVNDRVERTYRWGMIMNVFVLALLGVLVSVSYVAMVGAHWWAVLLLVVCLLYFICGVYPTAKDAFCGMTPVTVDLQP